jgi:hydrogenase maturation protease
VLVIGIGNLDRGDDGAGCLVARRVGGIDAGADPLALLEVWDGNDDVVVVDAMVSGAAPGTVRWIDPSAEPLPAGLGATSTHALGLAEVVALARVLGRLPARLRVVGIEAADCRRGAPLTPAVGAAVEAVVAELT